MSATRRQLLIGGLQVTALLPALRLRARGVPAAPEVCVPADRALVVVELTGGNDGLNTLVPHRQDTYFRARPTLCLERASLHRIDDDHGLHPEMGALGTLFAEGRAAAVHSVGYPDPDRSHFRSMEIWHTADPAHPAGDTGWLGRLLPQLAGDAAALPALHVGSGDVPLALRAADVTPAPSCADERGFQLHPASARLAGERAALAGLLERESTRSELAWLRDAARASYAVAERMAGLADANDDQREVEYPEYGLARRLRLVARLVAGGLGTRLFYTSLGGFDTHARQAPAHAALLREFSESVGAFHRDLAARGLDGRVVTFAFSEFGRRVAENGSGGTDHGAGAPVWLAGGSLRAGLHGSPPDLARLERGDVPFTTDLRAVYAALERDWLGLAGATAWPGIALF